MKPHLVIVDDDPLFRSDLVLVLQQDFRCTQADSTEHALQVHQEDPAHLMLLDVNLGENESGFDLLRSLRAVDNELPVIMTSDRPSVSIVIEAMRWNVRDFLPKTAGLDEIRKALKNAIPFRSHNE